jgi:NAD(P)-dependent dehydrogenase (short-subunit alcohol dehydrogenase family)
MRDDRPVVIVVGAAGGMGQACVRSLVQLGASVVAVSRTTIPVRPPQRPEKESLVRGFALDLASADEGDELVDFAVQSFGRLDAFVNTAAVYIPSPATSLTPELWDQVMAPNLRGALLVASSVARHLAAQGRGRIVQVSSITALVSRGDYTLYEASKAGLIAATRSMAVELAPRGVTVNSVAPGWVRTPMSEEILARSSPQQVADLIPVGRVGEPEEIADVVSWLAVQSPGYLTGQTIVVDGGQTARTTHL